MAIVRKMTGRTGGRLEGGLLVKNGGNSVRVVQRIQSFKARNRTADAAAQRPGALIIGYMDTGGIIRIDSVAQDFGMSKSQLADTVGLHRDSIYKSARMKADKTQARVREMLEIISRVSDWAGGKEQAMAWYRAQPIPAFGGRTAESIVKSGQAGAVRDYLDHLAMGGFA